MNIKVIAIDLAKNVFQLCALDDDNKVVFNRAVRRDRLAATIAKQPACVIAMEACASANYWGRKFRDLGHTVRLIPAQHVKSMLRRGKNDANDALAIAEAVSRPNLHFVPIKTLEQQDLAVLHRVRQRRTEQRTAVINQLRGLAAEYGVVFPKGREKLLGLLHDALDRDNRFTLTVRMTLSELAHEIQSLTIRIDAATKRINEHSKANAAVAQLQTIPGFGPIVASAFVASIGDGCQFRNGRAVSASTGLVPRQHGTGGKTRLGKITKAGDRYLRYQLINAARAVVTWAHRRDDALGRWVQNLRARSSFNNAVTALANKLARIAWHVLRYGEDFDLNLAFRTEK